MIDLARFPSIVLRWWPLLVAGLVVGGLTGYLAVRGVPPVYQAGVTLQVVRSPEAAGGDPDRVQTLIRTYAELARTQPILAQAAARAGVPASAAQLLDSVSATPVRETNLLRLVVEDTDPERVAGFATALADVLTERLADAQATRFAASVASVGRLIDALRATIDDRELKLAQLRSESVSPARDAALAVAEGELLEVRTSFTNAMRAQADLRLLEARGGQRFGMVEPPQVPNAFVRPSRTRAIGLGLFGGLTVALAVIAGAVLLEGLLSRNRRLAEVTGLPVLTEVPPDDGTGAGVRMGKIAACYEHLPARIAAQGVAVRSILVTSAQALSARNTVAASTAVALARSGRRVVLVDGNLRDPAQAALFGLADGPGFSTLLFSTGKSALALLRETAIPGLQVLTAGPLPPDPATFLREHSTRERLAELYAVSDVVIVDAPPISVGPDALLIGLDTDATLLAVDAAQALGEETTQAVSALEACGIHTIGTVLHGVSGRTPAAKGASDQQADRQRPVVPGQLQLTPSGGEAWSQPPSRA